MSTTCTVLEISSGKRGVIHTQLVSRTKKGANPFALYSDFATYTEIVTISVERYECNKTTANYYHTLVSRILLVLIPRYL